MGGLGWGEVGHSRFSEGSFECLWIDCLGWGQERLRTGGKVGSLGVTLLMAVLSPVTFQCVPVPSRETSFSTVGSISHPTGFASMPASLARISR